MAAEIQCPTTADLVIAVILEGGTVVLGEGSPPLGCPACMGVAWVDTEVVLEELVDTGTIQWAVVMQKTGMKFMRTNIHRHMA